MERTGVELKLLIDTNAHRVVYAEADKKIVDFLFNILSLPIGTVIKLLNKENMVGCLGSLYESVETLNDTYLVQDQSKDVLLKPRVTFCGLPNLVPDNYFPTVAKFYFCPMGGSFSTCRYRVADHPEAICSHCKSYMNQVGPYEQPPITSPEATLTGGYVKDLVNYMVMDDLSVKPLSTISIMNLLNKFNIRDVGLLQEKLVTFDVNQGVKLLKASLESKNVLTDIFLRNETEQFNKVK